MAMPSAPSAPGATHPSLAPSTTLRTLLDARRNEGRRMSLEEAVAVIVPVALDLQERHARGERLYVHPSAIAPGPDGLARLNPRLAVVPTNQHDKHCLAPELQRTLEPGDAISSVYSLGAILYEMVTGLHIGPAMKRPRDVEPSLPEHIEILIGKAIIGDRAHRPGDIGALASAMYHVAPQHSIHPPDVSEARLDASAQLEVDVRFSMLPPGHPQDDAPPVPSQPLQEASGVTAVPRAARVPSSSSGDPFGGPVIDRTAVPAAPSSRRLADDPTARLAALKARLESDPRPRYVVIKDKMDHGPFSAVELLQQIASHQFTGDNGLRDEISGQQQPISEWEEFAPFAEQTSLVREKRAEEKAVVRAADADKRSGVAKSIVAISVVVALAAVLAVWFFTRRGLHKDEVVVARDPVGTIDVNGDIKGKKGKGGGGGGGGGGGAGGYAGGGQSFDDILNSNNQTITMGQGQDAPDLTNAQLSAPLRHASFISSCGAPDDMHVTVRVAVKMGRAVGVTVSTNPPNGGVAACIDRAVRGLQWPQSPKADFVTTSY
jgi:hypothetical protein